MKMHYLNLDKVLDIAKWQKLQDSLAKVTKMAIITVDYKGIPITSHSGRQRFCADVRNDPKLEQFCHKCDSRGGLEAARINAPYIYLCHCGIVDIAVPILIDGKYIGAVMAGEIRLPDNEENAELEQILLSPSKSLFATEDLQQLRSELPILSLKEIQQSADMLYELCAYVVEEAMNKHLILETYAQMAASNGLLPSQHIGKDLTLENLSQAPRSMDHVTGNANAPDKNERFTCKNPILHPAFTYLFENITETVTQKQMARLCHISTSHFSRLFTKEAGESFSSFTSRAKVEWAKKLLEESNFSVTQISDELGFSDPGYFIKTFKKYEKITPAVYRKYVKEANAI